MADDNSRNTLVTSTRSLLHDPPSPPTALADPGLEKISPDSDGGTRKRSCGRPVIAESERESNASRWSAAHDRVVRQPPQCVSYTPCYRRFAVGRTSG